MQADRELVLGCREAEWHGAPIRLGRAEERPRRGAGCGAGKGLGVPTRLYVFIHLSVRLGRAEELPRRGAGCRAGE